MQQLKEIAQVNLHYCASNMTLIGCLKVLLEAGCNPNEPGLQPHPPLLIASKNGHTK